MYKVGYTQGVFDMFHVGHLRLINHAKDQCELLIVGVNSDSLVQRYKNKVPIINESDRAEIVSNLKAVNQVKIVDTLDKIEIYNDIHFDAIFIGDDWKGNTRWSQTEKDLAVYDVPVVYLPYTKNISSTLLKSFIIPPPSKISHHDNIYNLYFDCTYKLWIIFCL